MKKLISAVLIITAIFILNSCNSTSKDQYINDVINKHEQSSNQTTTKATEQTMPPRIIHFETNGGSKIDSIDLNQYEGMMPIPSKEDHDFLGWYLDPGLNTAVTYPFRPDGINTVYAKWVKVRGNITHNNSVIEDWGDYKPQVTYIITPNGFDLQELQKNNYNVKITASYKVYYEKDSNAIFDIGYLGAPQYQAYMYANTSIKNLQSEITPTTSKKLKEISISSTVENIIGQPISLQFLTENIQNKIHFEDIVVTYEFYK